jgi:hypothetical protein
VRRLGEIGLPLIHAHEERFGDDMLASLAFHVSAGCVFAHGQAFNRQRQ